MHSPLLILAEPEEVFTRVQSRAPWFLPLTYCTLGFFILTWLGGCWENLSEGLRWWSLLGPAIVSPLVVGGTAFGSTMVLYFAHWVVGGRTATAPGYRMFLSLNTHCAMIIILGEVVNFLLVHADVLQGYIFPLANRFPLGLDLLLLGVKEPNIYLTILLHSTNVFLVWYLVILANGLRYVTNSSWARSTAIVTTLWLVGVTLVVGIVHSAGGGMVFRVIL